MKYLQIFFIFFLKCVFLSSWSYLAWDRISLESRNCFLPIIISKRQSLLSSSLINALFKYCLSQLWSISTTFSRASIFVLFITCGNWTLLPLLDTTCKKILINFNSLILDIFPPHHDDCNDDQTNIDNDEMIEEHCETDPAPAACWTCCSKIKNIIDCYQGIISNSNTIISSSVRAYLWLVPVQQNWVLFWVFQHRQWDRRGRYWPRQWGGGHRARTHQAAAPALTAVLMSKYLYKLISMFPQAIPSNQLYLKST